MMTSGRVLTPVALCFAATLPPAGAAPAPAGEQPAAARFEALKKRLPRLADDWLKQRWEGRAAAKVKPRYTAEVQVARLVGPAEAKVTVVVGVSLEGKRREEYDEVLTVFLRYHRGAWTTTGFKASWSPSETGANKAAHFLLLAIDRSEEK